MVRILAVAVAGLIAPLLWAFAGTSDPGSDIRLNVFESSETLAEATIEAPPEESQAAASVPADESAFHYTVRPGDTLWDIARLFDVPMSQLMEANAAWNGHISPGERLAVPLVPADRPFDHADPATEAVLRQVEADYDLPHGLLLALAWQESSWRQHAVSSAGAIGITQIMPSTADWAHEVLFQHELNWRESTYDNARMGAAYLAFLLDRADGDVWLALAAYYQGWDGVHSNGAYAETERYVRSVLALIPGFQ